ncbi:MAG TPA: VIT domain-containing protein [Abditibacteriaceae bacterium]|jgi:Ca-activated chloride channel family protein
MKRSLFFAGAAFVLGAAWYQAHAQRTVVPPIDQPIPPIWRRPPRPFPLPPQREVELKLDSQAARVEIRGAVARTKLTQTFINTANRTVEGYYLFPLPPGAAIGNFAMTLNGKRLESEVLDGDRAREIYNGIVAQWRDPAILEFTDRDVVRARLFPIAAGDKPIVELSYDETLRAQGDSFRYLLPQRLAVGGAAQRSDVEIRLFDENGGARAIYSPTHEIQTTRDDKGARVGGEWKDASAGRDLVLLFSPARGKVALSVVTHREGDDGYFLLLAAPDAALAAREIAAKDVVFVCDTSGSMQGEKIEQARRALQTLVGTLGPNDRFGLVTFATDVNNFRDGLTPASKANVDSARAWTQNIKAIGGTNINDALLAALKMFEKTNRPQQIVFLTDGLPTVGERDTTQILKNVRAERENTGESTVENARLFTFGVGYDVNTKLLDGLAEENRGASDYVAPEQDIEVVVGALGQKIAAPVFTDLKIDFGGVRVSDVYPKALPDLFRGGQVAVFGRFDLPGVAGDGLFPISLTGMRDGKSERIESRARFVAGTSNESIARLWAVRKVGYLLDDARRAGKPVEGDARDEIIKLSKKWGIVTPLTAGLITEDEPLRPAIRNGGLGGGFGARGSAPAAPMSRAAADESFRASSGEAAVNAAKATGDMRRAETVREDVDLPLRVVAGKSFSLRDGVWTDLAFDAKTLPKPKTIKFASPEYFALLRNARMAKWLALGDRVIWTWNGETIQIVP